MRIPDLFPALALPLVVTAAIAAGRLLPTGDGPVLVRLDASGLAAVFGNPALADIALVNTPAPGFAVLKGDAALIRSNLGLTVAWQGDAPCSSSR